jgi:transaldolase/glucose-6-phosphate isomerase
MGKVAIANAKLTYREYLRIYNAPDVAKLIEAGVKPQRLLWASTSTKNNDYSDTLYVESLIGDQTINTLPPATYSAFKDHGVAASNLDKNLEMASKVMSQLKDLNINFEELCEVLLKDGIKLFDDAFDQLLSAILKKAKSY